MDNISFNALGEAQFFNVGGPAWHRFGATLPEKVGVETALNIIGGNYDVEKAIAVVRNGKKRFLRADELVHLDPVNMATEGVTIAPVETLFWGEDLKAYQEQGYAYVMFPITVMDTFNRNGSTGHVYGMVKKSNDPNDKYNGKYIGGPVTKSYKPIPNRAAIGFCDAFLDKNEAVIVSAGIVGRGERMFLTLKLPDHITFMGEQIDRYVVVLFTHDGSEAVRIFFTPIRVVCENTFHFALNTAKNDFMSNMQTIRHSANGEEMLKQVPKLMGLQNEFYKEMGTALNTVYRNEFNKDGFLKAWGLVFCESKEIAKIARAGIHEDTIFEVLSTRKANMFGQFAQYYNNGPGQDIDDGWYKWWNALSGYYANAYNYETDTENPRNNMQKRFETLMYGTGAKRISQGFDLAYNGKEKINALWEKEVKQGEVYLQNEEEKIRRQIEAGALNLSQLN